MDTKSKAFALQNGLKMKRLDSHRVSFTDKFGIYDTIKVSDNKVRCWEDDDSDVFKVYIEAPQSGQYYVKFYDEFGKFRCGIYWTALFVKKELFALYDKACIFVQDARSITVDEIYRNKPKKYWDNIKDGIEQRYVKDMTGSRSSVINGVLKGLFFNISFGGGRKLPKASPFGNVRLIRSAQYIMRSDMNIFFADFYCTSGRAHYVTLVCALVGTKENAFCETHLYKMPHKNPFLTRDFRTNTITIPNPAKFWVELLITNDINLESSDVEFRPCPTFGKGHSTKGGVPKHKTCKTCNI